MPSTQPLQGVFIVSGDVRPIIDEGSEASVVLSGAMVSRELFVLAKGFTRQNSEC